jgi:hypothetical protein
VGHRSIYHITHVNNLASIIADGCLFSDSRMVDRGGPQAAIGMSRIKLRRLKDLEVACHPGSKVGEYVPFYFCPRSVMLYMLHKGNHPDLTYQGGQEPIVHLVCDLEEVIDWAVQGERLWAFSLSNAGASYAQFRKRADQLSEITWSAVAATNWSSSDVKEGKQAEFLVHGDFPWRLVREIGVRSEATRGRTAAALGVTAHRPRVQVRQNWYY